MLKPLKDLLKYLENHLDEQKLKAAENLHQAALCWQNVPRLPIIASYPYPGDAPFQPLPHGQVFDNPEIMLFNQLVNAFDSSICLSEQIGDDLSLAIRADFGCILIASLFGATVEQVDNNPPWIRHDQNNISYEQIMGQSSDGFKMGCVSQAASCYKFYRDILADYPRLARHVNLTLPDLQGPIDNLELIRGSDIFTDMLSRRDVFYEAMAAVTQAQIEMVKYFIPFIKETSSSFSHQHGVPLKGGLLIRNDTAIMVGPKIYREMIAPFDEQLLKAWGGGIHSCGNVNKMASEFMSLASIQCFDFGQSELNDVETIYETAQAKKVALIRVVADEPDLLNGKILEKYPTGVSLLFRATSYEHAKNVITGYKHAVP